MELKKALWLTLKVYIFLFTAVGFTMFICEEVMQTAMFGAFAYNNAKDYSGLNNHINEFMIPAHKLSKGIIYGIGWINPIMWPAYLGYVEVNEGFIRSQQVVVSKNR